MKKREKTVFPVNYWPGCKREACVPGLAVKKTCTIPGLSGEKCLSKIPTCTVKKVAYLVCLVKYVCPKFLPVVSKKNIPGLSGERADNQEPTLSPQVKPRARQLQEINQHSSGISSLIKVSPKVVVIIIMITC